MPFNPLSDSEERRKEGREKRRGEVKKKRDTFYATCSALLHLSLKSHHC